MRTNIEPLRYVSQRRTLLMPGGGLLVGMGDLQEPFFRERFADELEADGHIGVIESTGDGQRRQSGQIDGDGENVGQIHGERVRCFFSEAKRRRRCHRLRN